MTTEESVAADIPTPEEILSSLEQRGYACSDLGVAGDGFELQRCETGATRAPEGWA
jgi:hypothetical protein